MSLTLADPERVYTVVCPGGARFEEDQVKAMKKKGDKRAHGGGGWNVSSLPAKCPTCGDEAQVRGAYQAFPLS